jgi:hypothetical protein
MCAVCATSSLGAAERLRWYGADLGQKKSPDCCRGGW